MKILKKSQQKFQQLKSAKGEMYSLSTVISRALDSEQLFFHVDHISPGNRASGPHRHSLIEEVVYVLKGEVSVYFGDHKEVLQVGDCVLFKSHDQQEHFFKNDSLEVVEILTWSLNSAFDEVITPNTQKWSIEMPESQFDENLWDRPVSIEACEEIVRNLNRMESEGPTQARLLQILETRGMIHRQLLKLNEAEADLKRAVSLSVGHPKPGKWVQNQIRLAHVYQWKKEFDKAMALLDQVRDFIHSREDMTHFVAFEHQHRGKVYFDQKLYKLAQAEFETALQIRVQLKVPEEQIQSSRESLKETLKRLQTH